MSQNVTLSTTISPVQSLALDALVSGGSITKAAKEAGVARETVSRWVHHDPAFLAELQNIRAEMAIQTRCALESLGMRAVGVLTDAIENQLVKPSRLRAACALLKMIGADRTETMASTTAEEVHVRLQEHEAELQERQGKLGASEAQSSRSLEVADNPEAPRGAAPVEASSASQQPVDDTLDDADRLREQVLNRFRESVAERVGRTDDVAVQPITIIPGAVDARSGQSKNIAQIVARISEVQSRSIPRSGRRHK